MARMTTHTLPTRVSHYALEMPNLSTVFAVPRCSLSPYAIEDSLFADTERSFGVRAACCRFLFRKLGCEIPNHRLNLHALCLGAFRPANLRESRPIRDSSFPIGFQPASWLEEKRQQAARTPKLRSEYQRWEIHTSTGEAGEKSRLMLSPGFFVLGVGASVAALKFLEILHRG